MQIRSLTRRRVSWLWALLPLLLAATLVVPLLDVDAFNGDEPASLLAAGILRPGPWSPAEVWDYTAPRHPPGWSVLLSVWGLFVGWSELAIRALSFFIGLLTLAWVYRAGRDFFAPAAGLIAALLLSASVFHLAFMVRAELYAPVALCAVICVWYYWRVALHPQQPGKGVQAGLLLGSIGLLYSHYFGALLLPILGLFHLLFVTKNRRWWRPVLLFGLATLAGALQLPLFPRGVAFTEGEDLGSRFLAAPAFLSHLLSYMTNGLVAHSPPAGEHLLLALLLVLMVAILLRKRSGIDTRVVWLLVFASATLLALVIAVNEALRIMAATRIRYIMPLWPMTALLVGAGLWRLANRQRTLVTGMLALWLISGAWLTVATDYRYGLGYFFRLKPNHVREILYGHVATTDFLLADYSASNLIRGWFDASNLGFTRELIDRYKADPYQYVRPVHANYPYLWLLYLSKDRVGIADLPQELGRVFCERVLDEWGFTLERYALHSVENCPDRPVRLAFDSGIRLTAPEITSLDGRLRLDAHFRSEDSYLLSRYSLAIHVIDPLTNQRVAQADTGVGPGVSVPLRSEIDVSALPPGDYEVRVALYDWQNGERLLARDLETGESGDMHTLHRFRID